MTVRVNKPAFNIREKITELTNNIGLKGRELMRAVTVQEARDLVSAGRKNMIINGAMNIFQRNNGGIIATGSSVKQYVVDRFGGQFQSGNVFTVERADNDAPPGFRYSLKYTTTNAVTPNSSHYFWVGQAIEGYNFQQCGWNTSNPKHITISFWVKSSVVGTWAFAIRPGTSAQTGYLATYDIHTANTWEYKTITVPPPFTLTDLQYTSSIALILQFDLGTSRSGDLYASVRNKWVNENVYADAGTVKIHGIAGATWQMTGLQLEVGKNATEFEHRSYGEELALCQRYFQVIATGTDASLCMAYCGSGGAYGSAFLPVTMRTTPTLYDQTSGVIRYRLNGSVNVNSGTAATLNSEISSPTQAFLQFTFSGTSTGTAANIRKQGSSAIVGVQAEL